MFKKFMGKDEIRMDFSFSDEGFLKDITIDVIDKEFFKSFDRDLNKIELDRLITNLFHNISSTIIQKQQANPNQNLNIDVKKVLESKICPRCATTMKVDENCCESLKKQGYAGVLKCEKCSYKVALNSQQLETLKNA